MIKGFWEKINNSTSSSQRKPIFASASMANVTDAAFRQMLVKYGKPDVIWTEFVSADGLCSDEGRKRLLIDLKYSKKERPIVAQIFGSKPENFYKSALLIKELGFDGIDINMGCPDKSIEKQGAGAALIKNPKLAQKIILETKRGAGDLPVSVKTRLGYKTNIINDWLKYLLETELAVITIHARTRQEKSGPPAHWDLFPEIMELVKEFNEERPLILGNGDVKSLDDAKEKIKKFGVDGIMVGRALIGNPWFFNKEKMDIELKERLSAMAEHAYLFEKLLKGKKNFNTMKKHFVAYCHGFDGAKKLKTELMLVKKAREVEASVNKFLKTI